jgi:hypothetical protein
VIKMPLLRSAQVVSLIGWSCFALELLFVLMLLRSRNVGDDAAGRGLGTAFGLVLLPLVLLVGGTLLWGTLAKSVAITRAGALLAALPFLVMVFMTARGMLQKGNRAINQTRIGAFADPTLTGVARAIDNGDSAAVKRLLLGATPDFAQRDAFGRTLLGHAVFRATSYDGTPAQRAMVRVLLEHGVPYAADATEVDGDWATEMAVRSEDSAIDLLDVALQHGADPNAIVRGDDEPVLFAVSMTPAKADLLVSHGADVRAVAPGGFRKGWTGLMNAAYQGQWEMARWFLAKGVPIDYVAPDGMTLAKVIEGAHALARKHGYTQHDEAAAFMVEVQSKGRQAR